MQDDDGGEIQPLLRTTQREFALSRLLRTESRIEFGLEPRNAELDQTTAPARLRTKELRELQTRILRAAWFVEDVIHNEVQLRPMVLGSSRTDLALAYLHRYFFNTMTTVCLMALILLSILERPRWTYSNSDWRYYPMYFPADYYLGPSSVNLLEAIIIALMTVAVAVKVYLLRERLFFSTEPIELRMPVYIEVVSFTGLFFEFFFLVIWSFGGQGSRIGNFFRAAMFCSRYPPIYNTWRLIFRLVPRILNVLALLTVFMLFASWCFWWIFIVAPPDAVNPFETIDSSYYHLLEILTQNNFPDLMMPFYDENSLSTLLFVAFITVGVFILLNTVIGVVFWHYQRQNNHLQKSLEHLSKRNIEIAFALLDVTGSKAIGVEEMILLLERMDMYRRLGTIQGVRVQRILYRLKPMNSSMTGEFIDLTEFHGIIAVLAEEFENVGPQSPLEIHYPEVYYLPVFQRLVRFVRGRHRPVGGGLGGGGGGGGKSPWQEDSSMSATSRRGPPRPAGAAAAAAVVGGRGSAAARHRRAPSGRGQGEGEGEEARGRVGFLAGLFGGGGGGGGGDSSRRGDHSRRSQRGGGGGGGEGGDHSQRSARSEGDGGGGEEGQEKEFQYAPPFAFFVDVVIFCHLMVLVAAVIDSSTKKHAYFYKVAEDVFINLYVAELLVRLLVVGPAYHLRGVANRVDSLLIVSVFCAMNLEILNNKYLHVLNLPSLEGLRVLQALVALRTVKLFRHLRMAPNFLTLMTSLDAVLDSTSTLFLTLLSFVYISASLGVAVWGGAVCRETTVDGKTICSNNGNIPGSSVYAQSDYYDNNFNDIASAMTLIFEVFVANNIWDLCDGLAAATGDVAGVRAYFVLNWGFGVNVLMNIVLSVVINSTLEVYGEKHYEHPDERIPIRSRLTSFNFTALYQSRRQRAVTLDKAAAQTTLAQDLAYELNLESWDAASRDSLSSFVSSTSGEGGPGEEGEDGAAGAAARR